MLSSYRNFFIFIIYLLSPLEIIISCVYTSQTAFLSRKQHTVTLRSSWKDNTSFFCSSFALRQTAMVDCFSSFLLLDVFLVPRCLNARLLALVVSCKQSILIKVKNQTAIASCLLIRRSVFKSLPRSQVWCYFIIAQCSLHFSRKVNSYILD